MAKPKTITFKNPQTLSALAPMCGISLGRLRTIVIKCEDFPPVLFATGTKNNTRRYYEADDVLPFVAAFLSED